MAYKTFYDMLSEVGEAKTKKEKLAALHKHSSPALKTVLGHTYDPRIKWLLPEGEPPYTPLPKNADMETRLVSELRRLYLFIEGDSDTQRNLKQTRREQLFIELLESVDPGDAKVLLGMKDGKLPFAGLTRRLVCEAFPTLTKDW
jgi:hypothetical protein